MRLKETKKYVPAGHNAILRRELLTTLRSKSSFITLLALVLVLSGVVVVAWPRGTWFIAVRSQIARLLFNTFAMGQILMMGILTTIYSAGSMTVEKEKRCIDFLMTAPISTRAIVVGKLFSSIAYVLLLLVATLPLASVFLFLGGISTGDVVQFYIALFLFAVVCGLIGLACSTFFHRTQAALAVSLIIVIPICLIWVTIGSLGPGFAGVFPSMPLLIVWSGIAFFLYAAIVKRMKKPFPRSARSLDQEEPFTQTGLVLNRHAFPDRLILPKERVGLLPDDVNPVYHKEISCEVFGSGTLMVRVLLLISLLLLGLFVLFLVGGLDEVFFCYVASFIMLIAPTFASNSFTQETERGTLDLLLTTPLSPRKIILGKVAATFRFTGILTGFLCVYIFLGFLAPEGVTFKKLLFYMPVLFAQMFACIVIALFFSLIIKGSLRSMVAT